MSGWWPWYNRSSAWVTSPERQCQGSNKHSRWGIIRWWWPLGLQSINDNEKYKTIVAVLSVVMLEQSCFPNPLEMSIIIQLIILSSNPYTQDRSDKKMMIDSVAVSVVVQNLRRLSRWWYPQASQSQSMRRGYISVDGKIDLCVLTIVPVHLSWKAFLQGIY